MKRAGRVAAVLATLLLMGGILPTSTQAKATATLASLVLRKADLPPGYTQTVAKSYSLQYEAANYGVSIATLRAQGWKGSYQATYKVTGNGVAAIIDSSVDQFSHPSGAAWDLSHGAQQFKDHEPQVKVFAVRGVGEHAYGIRLSETRGKIRVVVVYVAFHRGSYLGAAGITVAGANPTVPLPAVELYARIIDDRLRSA